MDKKTAILRNTDLNIQKKILPKLKRMWSQFLIWFFFYSCFIHAPNLWNYNKKDSGESRCGVGKLSTRAIRRKSDLAMFKRKKTKKAYDNIPSSGHQSWALPLQQLHRSYHVDQPAHKRKKPSCIQTNMLHWKESSKLFYSFLSSPLGLTKWKSHTTVLPPCMLNPKETESSRIVRSALLDGCSDHFELLLRVIEL